MLRQAFFTLALQLGLAPASNEAFGEYVESFGKAYASSRELQLRQSLFEERAAQVEAHNSIPGSTWVAGYNDFTDATDEELQRLLGFNSRLRGRSDLAMLNFASRKEADEAPPLVLPDSVDWRLKSPAVVSPVKNQGGCGSCWAFAATEVIESHVALQTGVLLSLSPQQITSCAPNPRHCGGQGGCDGSTAELAFDYVIAAGGLADIWHYPYLSALEFATLECRNESELPYPKAASITGFASLPENDAPALMEAIASKGPIAVSVDASAWWMYASGIFDSCNKTAPNVNHAVVGIGYGIENNTKYWLVRNSWGNRFGEDGYIRLRRYDDEPCGQDPRPQDGFGCEDDEATKQYIACGECGVLSMSNYPTGAKVGPVDTVRRVAAADDGLLVQQGDSLPLMTGSLHV